MSRVPSSKRKPSEVEFITNAEKIHELVIRTWRQSILKSYNACYTTINALDNEFKEIFGREFEL